MTAFILLDLQKIRIYRYQFRGCLYVKFFEMEKHVQNPYTRLQTGKMKAYFSNKNFKGQMCFQLCYISRTNNMQKAGFSSDGIHYYLTLVRQNP